MEISLGGINRILRLIGLVLTLIETPTRLRLERWSSYQKRCPRPEEDPTTFWHGSYAHNPIVEQDGAWWHYDETWSHLHGPFATWALAQVRAADVAHQTALQVDARIMGDTAPQYLTDADIDAIWADVCADNEVERIIGEVQLGSPLAHDEALYLADAYAAQESLADDLYEELAQTEADLAAKSAEAAELKENYDLVLSHLRMAVRAELGTYDRLLDLVRKLVQRGLVTR